MREILFRAKNHSGEWVYGYYVNQYGVHEIRSRDDDKHQDAGYYIEPETVGQYTGLKDKNGNKIFEGDILEYAGERYYISFLQKYARFAAVKPHSVFVGFAYERGEVIGNVYDDENLLEG